MKLVSITLSLFVLFLGSPTYALYLPTPKVTVESLVPRATLEKDICKMIFEVVEDAELSLPLRLKIADVCDYNERVQKYLELKKTKQ
jgi:hypothetical protein